MKLIQTITLTSAQASINFTSIPQTFTDLVILMSVRDARTAYLSYAFGSFNSTTTGYTFQTLEGSGASANAARYTSGNDARTFGYINGNSSTASTFGNSQTYITNYTSSVNKTWSVEGVSENNASSALQALGAGVWANTGAITSISLTTSTPNFEIGSTVSLYGILKGAL
jgi:hypothetical protein